MNYLKPILTWIFASILIAAGVNHFINPKFYAAIIPAWLPMYTVNYITGLIEIGLGIGLIIKKSKRLSAIGVMILMVLFLPLHFIDALKVHPAIGSHLIAYTRFAFQFILIYWGWYMIPAVSIKNANN